jgi:hypothetical protein
MTQNLPAYTAAIWEDGRVINKGRLPLWSGKNRPPFVGDVVTCADKKGTRVKVTGYAVEDGWLMVEGYRVEEPGVSGNLAGAEIL